MTAESFIGDMDKVVEIVADWAVEAVLRVYEVLTGPDGRPWDTVEQTMDERLQAYLALKGNPQAWAEYVQAQSQAIGQKLLESGLDETDILSVHPYDIATKFAIEYSVEMETELRKRAA